ncbi:phenylacetate--CoA ligase family protein [Isoptericola jiangsuensis]|uniref:phenylacetate--CoA ligase family protein n=1 Tax=Isoptericola jiangsuensis TaxID=548579 RepID=UPI003AB0C4D5
MIPLDDDEAWRRAKDFTALHRAQWSGTMGADQLDEYQRMNLGRTLDHCRNGSPFYQARLSSVTSTTPFQAVPLTTKDDLRTHLDDVPSLRLDESWVYYETTGTTGTSTPCPRNVDDSVRTAVALSESYRELLAPYGRNLVFAVMGPTELHSTGDTFGDVFRNLGHTSVKMWPHSPVVGMGRAAELLHRLQVDAMVCTPGMAILLARYLSDHGMRPDSLGMSVIFTLGELATPRLLEQIGRVWGTDVHSCMYASQEASVLAVPGPDGALRSTPLNYYYEMVDPSTGDLLDDRREEREGELVVTHLYQGAKPLVRYRTGDVVRARGVGQDFTVVPVGRVRDRIVVGGRDYSAFDFEVALLDGCPEFLDYQVTIDDRNGRDRLTVLFEAHEDARCSGAQMDRYTEAVRRHFEVPVTVAWGRTDERTSTGAMVSWKAARIRDLRSSGDGEARSSETIAEQRAARIA